ncbi:MAG: AAA family ATPase [Acidobacteria bacterium]|nr:AAA family ATPase [Acidobacteriota bacterium]
MFLDFYRLREQPFGDTPDPRFLYLSETHREALASLYCGIETSRAFLALIAEPGLGKTILVFELLERLQHSARTVFLSQTQCDSSEFVRYLLDKLGIETQGRDRVDLDKVLDEALNQEMLAGRRFVLVIDEAQSLDESVLETVRLLSDFETPRGKKLQIILAGPPQLADKLANPALAQLRQRVSILGRLAPLNREDTARYIEHRLKVAGRENGAPFTPSALERIAEASQGIPRSINNLCFGALFSGYALGREKIDAAIIDEVAADLNLNTVVPARRARQSQVSLLPPTTQLSNVWNGWSGFGPRAIGVAVLAAALVVVGGYAFSSTAWRLRAAIGQPRSVPTSAEDARVASQSLSLPAGADVPGTDPKTQDPAPGQTRQEKASLKTIEVMVEPKQTLRQICLRNIGRFDNRLVEEIRGLNAWMQDPNHLEVGQRIQLPEASHTPEGGRFAGETTDKPKPRPTENP